MCNENIFHLSLIWLFSFCLSLFDLNLEFKKSQCISDPRAFCKYEKKKMKLKSYTSHNLNYSVVDPSLSRPLIFRWLISYNVCLHTTMNSFQFNMSWWTKKESKTLSLCFIQRYFAIERDRNLILNLQIINEWQKRAQQKNAREWRKRRR